MLSSAMQVTHNAHVQAAIAFAMWRDRAPTSREVSGRVVMLRYSILPNKQLYGSGVGMSLTCESAAPTGSGMLLDLALSNAYSLTMSLMALAAMRRSST